MKREIKILLMLIFSTVCSVATEKNKALAEPKQKQPVAAAFAVFKTGSLKEAKICLARLDAMLAKDPTNERFKKLKASIKDLFLADHAMTQAIKNKDDAEKNIKSKQRNLRIVSTPSTLSRKINKQEVSKAKKELKQANAELKKATKNIPLAKKSLADTIKRISEGTQPQDRELLDAVSSKIAKRHEPPKPKKQDPKNNPNKK